MACLLHFLQSGQFRAVSHCKWTSIEFAWKCTKDTSLRCSWNGHARVGLLCSHLPKQAAPRTHRINTPYIQAPLACVLPNTASSPLKISSDFTPALLTNVSVSLKDVTTSLPYPRVTIQFTDLLLSIQSFCMLTLQLGDKNDSRTQI